MIPVRVVKDIMHPGDVAASRGGRAAPGRAKKFTRAALRLFAVKIPFLAWLFIVFFEAGLVMKIAPELIFGAEAQRGVATNVPQAAEAARTVIGFQNIVSAAATSTASSTIIAASTTVTTSTFFVLAPMKPGLLPVVPLSKHGVVLAKKPVAVPSSSQPGNTNNTSNSGNIQSVPALTVLTAQTLLGATTFSLKEGNDGLYKITFTTNAGAYGNISWGLNDTTLAIPGTKQNFSLSSSCDPLPTVPAPDASDQNPSLDMKTSYTCIAHLAPTAGDDRRTQSRQFSFTTGAGQLVVTSPSSMNAVLTDGMNLGGFVFRNDSKDPITITGLDVDVSYQGLNILNGPLVLRFKDPATEAPLADYHLENLAADPSAQAASYAHAATGIHIPLSFTINGMSQKMLPINVLGVQRMSVLGLDPTVTVALRKVTTDQNLNRIILNATKVMWSCIVPAGAYDPSAPTGAYATGEACQ